MKKDLNLVRRGFLYIYNDCLKTIFRKKSVLKNVGVISFDDGNLYIFYLDNHEVKVDVVPHTEKILEDSKKGLRAYLVQKADLYKYIKDRYSFSNIISGGLFSDYSAIQKQKGSIYTSEESYIATIVHEFAHIYFNTLNPFYYADMEYNVNLLKTSQNLFTDGDCNVIDFQLCVPSSKEFSEIFAFCTEYEFAKKIYPNYYNQMNNEFFNVIGKLIEEEKKKDLMKEDSVLFDVHIQSYVLGKTLMSKYPNDWADRLINKREL